MPRVQILTSLIGYGVYFPAYIVARKIKEAGIVEAGLQIFEHLYKPEKKEVFDQTRQAFSKDYRLAKLAAKIPVDYTQALDLLQVEQIYHTWDRQGVTEFLCFSGLWFGILSRYCASRSGCRVFCCRLDAGAAHTWENKVGLQIEKQFFFFDLLQKKVNYKMNLLRSPASTFRHYNHELIVHGGGWGLGDFMNRTESLTGTDYHQHVIVPPHFSSLKSQNNATYYMNDPAWNLLDNSNCDFSLPALIEICSDQRNYIHLPGAHHAAFDLLCGQEAVICKPGGMSLADSIASGVPLIYLEPMGMNEEGNQEMIDTCQLGCSFSYWEGTGFDPDLLRDYRSQLQMLQKGLPDFTTSFLQEIYGIPLKNTN